jgi:DNA-binding NtrC family response regulator
VLSGPNTGDAKELPDGRALVGRADTADVRLSDPTVSQFHAEIVATQAAIAVRDLGSHNGTRVADIVVRDVSVASGTEVMLGSTRLLLESGTGREVERSKATSFGGLVGMSPEMRELYAVLERLSRTEIAVLFQGGRGTGKKIAAHALYDASPRAKGSLTVVECAGLPPALADQAVLGPGGILESSAGGTVVFSEPGELGPVLQVKLAQALESRRFDVRILTTTRRDLRALVNRGAFRENLYYALAQAHVRVPSLAERKDDVVALAMHFLALIPFDVQAARAIAPDALEAIAARAFPDNVRELKATIERVAMLAEGPTITTEDLAFERVLAAEEGRAAPLAEAKEDAPLEPFKEAKRTLIDEFERGYLVRLLARSGTNISRAAALAGIERQSLRDLLKRHGLRGDDG